MVLTLRDPGRVVKRPHWYSSKQWFEPLLAVRPRVGWWH